MISPSLLNIVVAETVLHWTERFLCKLRFFDRPIASILMFLLLKKNFFSIFLNT